MKSRITKWFDAWVDLASNVDGGIEMCKKKKYDLIFFDYLYLSNIDGLHFLFDVKRKGEQQAILVMMSGFIKSLREIEKMNLGVLPDEFIPKPFPREAIETVIEKHFPGNKKHS